MARSVELHLLSTAATAERAVAGVTSGLIGLDDAVTWEARHFGVRQRLTSRITAFDRPRHFRDSQVRGAFRRFDHDHFFVPEGVGTWMSEVFDYDAPFGLIGRVAERLLLTRYMRRFLLGRMRVVKEIAESTHAVEFLPPAR